MKKFLLTTVLLLPFTLNAGFWNKVEKAAEKVEKVNEKEEKIDRLNRAVEEKEQKRRDKIADKEHKANQKKMMENNMCTQYNTMNSDMMKQAFASDPTLKANMEQQIISAIDAINIEYKRAYGKTYNYKKECKK